MQDIEHVGPRLRAARSRMGWTLSELARRSGLSVSTLSRIESGKRQLSLELLLPLTRELGLRLDDLVQPEVTDPRIRRTSTRKNGMVTTPLTRDDSPAPTFKVSYPPTRATPAQQMHQGFEWFYVLSGKVRLRLGDKEFVLGPGEAAEFDTGLPHSLSAIGPRGAEVISMFNRDGARGHRHSDG